MRRLGYLIAFTALWLPLIGTSLAIWFAMECCERLSVIVDRGIAWLDRMERETERVDA